MKAQSHTIVRTSAAILCALFLASCAITFVTPIIQANMSSNSFLIQYNNVNMTSGEKSSSTYNVTDTVGQTANGQYTGTGYLVRSGFQYIYTIGAFSFVISNTNVGLGTLTPGAFATATTSLAVSTRGAGGYIVTAYESNPLKIPGTSASIPNTTCDGASCNYGTAGVWTNASNTGFGYNMTGNDYPAGFVDSTYFKAFADYSQNQPPQVIMSNSAVVKNRQGIVTYKAAIAGSQQAGTYENRIIYIATPGY